MGEKNVTRRDFIRSNIAVLGAAGVAAATGTKAFPAGGGESGSRGGLAPRKFRLGLVTYNMARDMDLPTLIKTCKAAGIEGVELRTTHKHGVEPTIGAAKRREVRKRFEDSGLVLWGLGTTCEFHSPDPSVVRKNIETCAAFCKLAEDVGARGVKVRPNGLVKKEPVEKTLRRIGRALAECGKIAADHGVEIWLEVHGRGTAHPPYIREIMDYCGHPRVGVCWNSNSTDIKNGSVREYFALLSKDVKSCHIHDLYGGRYPYRELFGLLRGEGYDRFTLAEIPGSSDPVRVLRYYRALWEALCG